MPNGEFMTYATSERATEKKNLTRLPGSGQKLLEHGLSIQIGALLIWVSFAFSITPVVIQQYRNTSCDEGLGDAGASGDISGISVAEQEPGHGFGSGFHQPTVNAQTIGGGSMNIFENESFIARGAEDLPGGVIDEGGFEKHEEKRASDEKQGSENDGNSFPVEKGYRWFESGHDAMVKGGGPLFGPKQKTGS